MVQWGGSPERRMDARWNFRWTYMLDGIFDGIFDGRNKKRYISLAMLLACFGVYTAGLESRNEIISDVSLAMFLAVVSLFYPECRLHIYHIINSWEVRWHRLSLTIRVALAAMYYTVRHTIMP